MDGLIAYALSKKYTDEVGRSILDAGFKTQVEQDRSILQTAGQEKILYFIPKTVASPSNGYDEYVYSNNAWEQVGATDVDLSSYATKAEVGNLNNLPTTDKSSIVSAISETFTSVSNGKSLVASAITDKGVSTSSDATFSEMAQNIEAIPAGSPTVLNPALVLWDWEGTKLAEYSAEDALALTELPNPGTLPAYAHVDHELLLFQKWNWSLANIKTWIQNHEGETRDVGAIYTTTDGQDHNFWNSQRLDTANTISMQKRGTTSIGAYAFYNCHSLTQINIPDGVTSIGNDAFQYCKSLCDILNESKSTLSNTNAFNGLPENYRIYVPRANLSWHETETNWATIYAQGHIVAIEDYIAYLESIGFNVDKYKEATP